MISTLCRTHAWKRGYRLYTDDSHVRDVIDKIARHSEQPELVRELLIFVAGNIEDQLPQIPINYRELDKYMADVTRWLGYFGFKYDGFGIIVPRDENDDVG